MSNKYLAIICQHFYPEMLSTGLFLTQMATGLVQRGWAVRVYCAQPLYLPGSTNPEDTPRYLEYEGVEIIRVPTLSTARAGLFRRFTHAVTFLLAIAWYLLRDHKSLLGVINTTNPPFLGLTAWFAKWCLGLPFLTIVHDIYPDIAIQLGLLAKHSPLTWLWERLTRLILNQSVGLIVIGRDMAHLVRAKLSRRSAVLMTLIPHWADETHLYPIPKATNTFVAKHQLQERFVVQYAGRMGRLHNLEPLLDAAQALQDIPVLFQFIGEGAKRATLESQAQRLGLQNVQFLSYQPYEELAPMLSAADLAVVCLDSAFTGASVPSKTYSVMACARPILALVAPHSEIGQLVQESQCGLVLPAATGHQIAHVIRQLWADPQAVQQMGQQGYRAFQANYTLTTALENYDLCLRRYFDHDLAYRTVQPPAGYPVQSHHEPRLYESKIG
ncbi:MAG: glycosyltransferase family 4 protein [Caldilineaceae bacterium]|nr:glycosyltransferase family 4 protein [Caldilineaceae bacterium]